MYRPNQLIAWVDLSTYCNAACPLCHRTNPKTLEKADWLPLVQWTYDQFVSLFPTTSLSIYDQFHICGTWGDPAMNKDLLDIVQYIIDNSDAKILINTNGSVRDQDWWWKLGVIGGKRLRLMIAVEGTTQQMHSLYRQSTSLDKIKENVSAIAATKAKVQIKVLVWKHNQDHLKEIEAMVKSWGNINSVAFAKGERFSSGNTFEFGDGLQLEQSTWK